MMPAPNPMPTETPVSQSPHPPLQSYACHPQESRGRLHPEPPSETRTCFQRDRDRIIHSAAFRRLQYKTQVFVNHEGDFYRTRLTHSLEVSQIARALARSLGLDQDLAETLALAHDLGHTPFGHAGEDALAEMMKPFGGFDHNAQSLNIVTRLEERYADFDGLNLTWETLEGMVKHNGPLVGKGKPPLPRVIAEYVRLHDLELGTWASAEAQVAALADDIAYNNHDIDDGLRAGLFSVDDLADVPLAGPVFAEVRAAYPDISEGRTIHEAIRRMIGAMINDLLVETRGRIADANPRTVGDIRGLSAPVASFSDDMNANDRGLKDFLFKNMYRHFKLNRMTSKARRVVKDLFKLFLAEPECLPDDWRKRAGKPDSAETAELVADYVAGMTDRFALDEHVRLFDLQARNS